MTINYREVHGKNIKSYSFEVGENCPELLINWFTEWFDNFVNKGDQFNQDQLVQYGWSYLKCNIQDSHMQLLAPDFMSLPIQWQSDITTCLFFLMEHKYVPESYNLDLDMPSLQDTAVVIKGFEEEPIIMFRMKNEDGLESDSGWTMNSLAEDADNNDPDNLEVVSLYELVLSAPHILRFLSMPVGTQIVFKESSASVFLNNEPLLPKKDSYMDKNNRAGV
ncbi:hypothetical protein MNBD_GAMMA12-2302 [hydrothermal vent metagenome]|uniref:Imm33-like domain-containing protein n=1 Tax=hydrothermal vent metagenome TaxID=652676 RepID=A0A3B0YF99_9ZZZZ